MKGWRIDCKLFFGAFSTDSVGYANRNRGLFLIWGCLLDPVTGLVLWFPCTPVAKIVGIDPVHFGVVVVLT